MPDGLSSVFSALADPTRRAIVARLSESDATVGELAEPFGLSLATVSRHIAALERAGLVYKVRRGQERHCSLSAARMYEAEEWISEYRKLFEGRFGALAQKLGAGSVTSQ